MIEQQMSDVHGKVAVLNESVKLVLMEWRKI